VALNAGSPLYRNLPEWRQTPTRRGHRENGAHDPEPKMGDVHVVGIAFNGETIGCT
jgi:hypothetical protein